MSRRRAPVRIKLNATTVWAWLARKNLSQNALARLLGVTTGHLSQLVNGNRGPSAALRRRMGEVLSDVAFDDLFILEQRDGCDGK